MNQTPTAQPRIRILLSGSAAETTRALAGWLSENESVQVTTGHGSIAETLALASAVRPHVVLLDFHGLPVTATYAVALFKELSPTPAVYVLTHDASTAMRRRCHAAKVDAVFDKTSELEHLRSVIAELAAHPAHVSAA